MLSLIMALSIQASAAEPQVEPPIAEATPAAEVVDAAIEALTGEEASTQPAAAITIPRDTPVHLMVLNEVSTKDHAVGHKFKLRVDKPVVVGGEEVIPVGAIGWGELTDAEKSGNVGKSGKLSARLLHIDLDGQEIPIEGETSNEGRSGKGATILGVIGLGPFGLLAKGNNAKMKAGEKMTAFVTENVVLSD